MDSAPPDLTTPSPPRAAGSPREAARSEDRGPAAAWVSVLISWIGILAVALAVTWPAAPEVEGGGSTEPLPAISMVDELGGRITLALCRAVGRGDRSAVLKMSGLGSTGPVQAAAGAGEDGARREFAIELAAAVLAGEAVDGAEGLERLPSADGVEAFDGAEGGWAQTRELVRLALEARSDDRPSGPFSEEDRATLRTHLGWFAEVVFVWEEDPVARKQFDVSLGVLLRMLLIALVWFLGFGIAGSLLLLTLVVAVAAGWMRPKVMPCGARGRSGRGMPRTGWWLGLFLGVPLAAIGGWFALDLTGGALASGLAIALLVALWPVSSESEAKRGGGPLGAIYAETFLIWILLFVGLQIAAAAMLGARTILESATFMIASLSALAWPRIRGIPFAQVREEIGLVWGRSWWKPPFEGLATYAIGLPLIVIGVGVAAVLTSVLGPGPPPSHPIQDEIASAGAGQLLSLLLIAAVIVPPIEEIVFRGVLYRHLREAFGRLGSLLGFAAAALASSLLFAALHPQGLGFVPILASLAVAFCIARELTGSVVPCMIAHGVSNAAIVALNAVLFSV
ncbi:MAG: CPBP family intramembrane glutamic endopeptidase [Phycisphaerales bacterium]